jgi:hypothetical protein
MDTRLARLLAMVSLPVSLNYAQPAIRVFEDLRSVTSEVPGFSNRSAVPEPAFEDPLVDLDDRVFDATGRIEGAVSQYSVFFDRYQHANTSEMIQRLKAELRIDIHGEGRPAHDTMVQESRWVLRFELVSPCAVQIFTSSYGTGELEAEFRLRRFDGDEWISIFEYVVGQPPPGEFLESLTNVGGLYELTQRNRLRGQAGTTSFAASSRASLVVEFTPFRSSWARWPAEQGGNDHWYRAVRSTGLIDRDAAAALASARGGYLASITSAAENDFVFAQVDDRLFWRVVPNTGHRNGPWLGAHQRAGASEPAGGWEWDSGEAFVYSNWAPDEPSNAGGDERFLNFYCRGCSAPRRTWNDHDSAADGTFDDRPIAYVVEYDGPPCPDFDESGSVDLADLATSLSAFGRGGGEPFAAGDCDGDGDVELDDLSQLLAAFGGNCP